MDAFKQRVFASAFGSFDPRTALKQYYAMFEDEKPAPEHDYDVEEFEPENEQDVMAMLNEARRAGAIQ